MTKSDAHRIAVLGAGPVGLEAALYARTHGLPVTVYERGRVAEHDQRWGPVRLFSPFGMNCTPLGRAAIKAENPKHDFPADGDCLTGRDFATVYLEPLAMTGKVIECLRHERGDLSLVTIDVPPTGLTLIRGLDSADASSPDEYERAVARYLPLPYDAFERARSNWHVVPDGDHVVPELAVTPAQRVKPSHACSPLGSRLISAATASTI